jgi:hypothetical protein
MPTESDNPIKIVGRLQYRAATVKGVKTFIARLNENLHIPVEGASLLHDPTDAKIADMEEPTTCP